MTYVYYLKYIKSEYKKFYEKQLNICYKYGQFLLENIPKYIVDIRINYGELEIHTTQKYLYELMFFLKNNSNSQFKQLIDICAYDRLNSLTRYALIYCLLSIQYNVRLSVLLYVVDLEATISLNKIYPSANWLEREVWDLFGIYFYEHPDLRKILTDYGFEGHPLRKDFPLTGFTHVFYDDIKKNLIYDTVTLAQEYRNFNFKNPWL